MEGHSEWMAVPIKKDIPSGCQPRSPQIRPDATKYVKIRLFKPRFAQFAQIRPGRQKIPKICILGAQGGMGPWALGGMGPMGSFGVIPQLFRAESHSERTAIPNGRPFQLDGCSERMANLNGRSFRKGPKGTLRGQGNPRGPRGPLGLFRGYSEWKAIPSGWRFRTEGHSEWMAVPSEGPI